MSTHACLCVHAVEKSQSEDDSEKQLDDQFEQEDDAAPSSPGMNKTLYSPSCPGKSTVTCTLTNVHTHPCTVPSGHILTEPELQVLSHLLAAYSNEKIKEIQQAIQEKRGRGVSRQEVERSLLEVGMMTIADELEQNIQKGTQ